MNSTSSMCIGVTGECCPELAAVVKGGFVILGSFQMIRSEMRRMGKRWTFNCSPFATARIYQQTRPKSTESGLTVISVGTKNIH